MIMLPSVPQYLGHVEVEESRGMHVCEDAVKKLKAVSGGTRQRGSVGGTPPGQAALTFFPHSPDGPQVRESSPVGVG